jgi:hypothetical protein
MSTTLKILCAVVAVLIILIWLYLRRKPRLHHYLFAQGFLPHLALSKPDEVLSALLSPTGHSREGDSFLIDLWRRAGEDLPPSKHVPAAGLTYGMEVLHSPRSAVYVIQLPAPLRPPEAYFAAIVFDSVAFAASQAADVRYFTLERSFGGLTMIGESRFATTGELEHIDHDECPATDKDTFLTSLRRLVTDTTTLDEALDAPANA